MPREDALRMRAIYRARRALTCAEARKIGRGPSDRVRRWTAVIDMLCREDVIFTVRELHEMGERAEAEVAEHEATKAA